jgi:hypothetical protein
VRRFAQISGTSESLWDTGKRLDSDWGSSGRRFKSCQPGDCQPGEVKGYFCSALGTILGPIRQRVRQPGFQVLSKNAPAAARRADNKAHHPVWPAALTFSVRDADSCKCVVPAVSRKGDPFARKRMFDSLPDSSHGDRLCGWCHIVPGGPLPACSCRIEQTLTPVAATTPSTLISQCVPTGLAFAFL